MRHHLSRTVLLVAAVVLCAWPAAARAEGHGSGARLVPAHVIRGVTGGELVGVDFARDYSGVPPPDCLRLGRRGEILQVGPNGGTITCTVKPGTPIFVFGWGSACSDIDPLYHRTRAVPEACFRTSGTSYQKNLRADSCPDLPAWKSALVAEDALYDGGILG